jgi:uronate dehydrogenase
LLLTGASGGLGKVLRPALRELCTTLRVSDLQAPADPLPGEESIACDVGTARRDGAGARRRRDRAFRRPVVEATFDTICHANIVGTFNVYEAARRHGVKRIVYASSGQVTGFYPSDTVVDPSMPLRPSSLYGVSKAFGESLSRLFYDRYGIETVCLRIAMAFPEPTTHRMLRSYLSYRDLVDLVKRGLIAKDVGHAIVYGVSANRDSMWRNPRRRRSAGRRATAPSRSARRSRRASRGPTRTTCRTATTAASSRRTARSRIAAHDAGAVARGRRADAQCRRRVAAVARGRGRGVLDRHSREGRAPRRRRERRAPELRRRRDGRLPRARRRRRAGRGDAPRRRAPSDRRRPSRRSSRSTTSRTRATACARTTALAIARAASGSARC